MTTQETYSYTADNLFAGTQVQPVVADGVVLASGSGVVERGTVLGKITASGKYIPVDSEADEGTAGADAPVCVLAETVNTADGDVTTAAYFTGEFNARAVKFGGSDTAATHKDALAARGIFLKDTVKA